MKRAKDFGSHSHTQQGTGTEEGRGVPGFLKAEQAGGAGPPERPSFCPSLFYTAVILPNEDSTLTCTVRFITVTVSLPELSLGDLFPPCTSRCITL